MADRLPLDRILDALDLAPHQLQAFDPAYPRFDAQRPLLVLRDQFVAARPALGGRYPAGAEARALVDGVSAPSALTDLPADADAWLLPALPPEQDRGAIAGLRGVMERLYAPDGCPWDREQTHETLRRYFLEECYELVDAIDRGDMRGLEEEVGDVLAHLLMQTALAQLAGAFTLEDVVAHASAKFVRRHPHVFGAEAAGSHEALLDRWEAIKAAERAERAGAGGSGAPEEGALDSVPAAAPALQRASALIGRALRAGVAQPPADAREELAAAAALPQSPGPPDPAAIGALLWSVVRLAREADVDAEEALRETCTRFVDAVTRIERAARERGVEPGVLGAEALRGAWAAVAAPPAAQ